MKRITCIYTIFLIVVIVLVCSLQAPTKHGKNRVKANHRAGILNNSYQIRIQLPQTSKLYSSNDILGDNSMWYEMDGCQVLLPTYEKVPKAIIHFIGGFILGYIPSVTYNSMLNRLADEGFLIVATPYSAIDSNHDEASISISSRFQNCYYGSLTSILGNVIDAIPIIGINHSLGGKLALLMCSRKSDRRSLPIRVCNIFLAFNNYSLKDSNQFREGPLYSKIQDIVNRFVPEDLGEKIKSVTVSSVNTVLKSFLSKSGLREFVDEEEILNKATKAASVASDFLKVNAASAVSRAKDYLTLAAGNEALVSGGTEFIPSPMETYERLVEGYNVEENIAIKFDVDTIDQSDTLSYWLKRRGCNSIVMTFKGNHLTPTVVPGQDGDAVAFQNFIKTLVSILNDVSNNKWALRSYNIGDDVTNFEKRLNRGLYELPGDKSEISGGLETWDDDNM